jgi:3-oxoacyl-[acyl-carrier protein] reductase
MTYKVMLITGSSKGIGRSLVEYYSPTHIVIGCSRSSSTYSHQNYTHLICDISDTSSVKNLIFELNKLVPRIDILVNNAGVNPNDGPFLLSKLHDINTAFQTNVVGTMNITKLVALKMVKQKFGRIITLGSMLTHHTVTGSSIYTACKYSLIGFNKVIAKELFRFGITCNLISPAAIESDLMLAVDKNTMANILSMNANQSVGDVKELITVLDFLISDNSSTITSQNIFLGGV